MMHQIITGITGAAAIALFVCISIAVGRAIAPLVKDEGDRSHQKPWSAPEYFGLGFFITVGFLILCGICWAVGYAILSAFS